MRNIMKEFYSVLIIGLALFVCNYGSSQDISNGLIAEYNFNSTTSDSSGNGFDAINNGALFTEDRLGNANAAILFDGINDFLELPNLLELKPELPVSFSFWIRYDSPSSSHRDVFNTSFEEDRNTGIYFNSQMSTGKFAVNFGDGGFNYTASSRRTYVANPVIETGEWVHIAVVIASSTEMKIYIDCLENGGDYSGNGGALVYSDTPGNIGRHDRDLGAPANYFKGAIDDFRYWNRDLLVSEINILCDNLDVTSFNFKNDAVTIYPNPSKGVFNFDTGTMFVQKIIIYNTLGQQVFENKYTTQVDLSFMAKGIYYVSFINDISIVNKKIIID
jgi:hypothetical protein